jgi:hypothetical protein
MKHMDMLSNGHDITLMVRESIELQETKSLLQQMNVEPRMLLFKQLRKGLHP